MSEGRASFKALHDFISDTAIPMSEPIEFDRENIVDVLAMTKYCSILEQSMAILALIDRHYGFHCYPLLKCQIENFADLKILIEDSDYHLVLQLEHLNTEKYKMISAKGDNPYFSQIRENIDIEGELSRLGGNERKLVSNGAAKIEIAQKLERAGLKDIYESVYKWLNVHSHNGIRAIENRHIILTDGGFEFVSFHPHEIEEFILAIETSFDTALNASVQIHEYFDTGHSGLFSEILESRNS